MRNWLGGFVVGAALATVGFVGAESAASDDRAERELQRSVVTEQRRLIEELRGRIEAQDRQLATWRLVVEIQRSFPLDARAVRP